MTVNGLIQIPEQWGLEVEEWTELSPRVSLIKTKKSKYIIKKKENVQKAHTELSLLKELDSEQFKVQMPVLSPTGDYTFTHNQDLHVIYEYIDGDIIQAKDGLETSFIPNSLGETIGFLHKSLKRVSLELADKFPDRDLHQIVYDWAFKEVMKVHEDHHLKNIFLSLESDIEKMAKELPKQLIHRDAHVSNFVFKDEKITGVLDFEIAEVNVRIFDICYCSTSVLSEVFSDDKLRQTWYKFIAQVVRGYSKANPLSTFEVHSMWHVMLCIQSIFMAFFCKDSSLFNTNKQMFLWIYENREKIEEALEIK
ncbi:phosphotransferase [Fictibacillus nanhaiensis]|uniref:phosphotransferase enzyme family protein n=1 Tax=Fictibacillus nanhaiensis TaxID=742169 RepID=UPI001C9664E0|nr:phosphotransferase [Fictibacillus nanhaiensis]MBY6035979.1 phosphotransferase [Fictibacillus nanhaiensis]